MSDRVCFIVASMDDRTHLMNKCTDAIKNSKYKSTDIYLYFQGKNYYELTGLSMFEDFIVDKNPRGVFTPRYELMKAYCLDYDYTVVIDDDLYVTEQTDYDYPISFLKEHPEAGCVSTSNTKKKNLVEHMRVTNVNGGLVIPKRSVNIILDYFKERERDYSSDAFWYLLWIKGYELYKDWRTVSIHRPSIKIDGKPSGYHAAMTSKPYVQIMPEWFNEPPKRMLYGRKEHCMLELTDLNEDGKREREKNLKTIREKMNQ